MKVDGPHWLAYLHRPEQDCPVVCLLGDSPLVKQAGLTITGVRLLKLEAYCSRSQSPNTHWLEGLWASGVGSLGELTVNSSLELLPLGFASLTICFLLYCLPTSISASHHIWTVHCGCILHILSLTTLWSSWTFLSRCCGSGMQAPGLYLSVDLWFFSSESWALRSSGTLELYCSFPTGSFQVPEKFGLFFV